uniref:RNA-dependent RNA polymerase n=1 Tax=Taiwan douglas-fir deltapartitivirus TaxID=2933092 RepID=A0A9C7LLZ4_9VIRU|nr:RNA-dependent RNA polymerase [Taiwan douglas-fir deltapartitivirus]CAI5384001.1 RNA-dependent RNA polymerase [Taiwan douglas-fir deltapartitivirus]
MARKFIGGILILHNNTMTNLHQSIHKRYTKPMELISRTRAIPGRDECIIYRDETLLRALSTRNPELTQELDGWARSFYTKEGHLSAISAYDRIDVPFPQDEHSQLVDEHLERVFDGFTQQDSLSFETQLKLVHFESDSAAGYGYTGRKGDSDNHRQAVRTANATIRDLFNNLEGDTVSATINWLHNTTPDIAFTRTQLSYLPDKMKIRNVWGAPFHSILIEGLTAQPIMEYFATHRTFFTIGEDPKIRVPQLISELIARNTVYCIDWSGFDASVSAEEIDFAFSLIKRMLNFNSHYDELCFEVSRLNFIHRKLIDPEGKILLKHRGVPSGSFFTMIIDSIVNARRILYIFHSITRVMPEIHCQGDDSLTGVPANYQVSRGHISAICQRQLWTINPDKLKISRYPVELEYLGRTSSGDYNFRERQKVIRLAIFTEYPVASPQISAARAHALCIDSSFRIPELVQAWKSLTRHYGEVPPEQLDRRLRPYDPTKFLRA